MSTAGLIFHVLNRAAKKAPLFECDQDYAAFEEVLSAAVRRFDVALFAYCLMRNHWHLVISPRADGELSRCMHWLTTTHVRRWQLVPRRDEYGAVYQGRFQGIPIGSDQHFLWVCRYVERNALRSSIVRHAEDWRWSSLWRRHYGDEVDWLSPWPVTAPAGWLTLVNTPQTQHEITAFRQSMRRGEPFGDAEWRNGLMVHLGIARRQRTRTKESRPHSTCEMSPDPLTSM